MKRQLAPSRAQRGFSLIEVMIASAVFLIVAIGLLPLFARSVGNNLGGRESTDVAHQAISRSEELFQTSFNNATLTVPAGATVLETVEYFSKKDQVWKAGAPTLTDGALWLRTTRVRQFQIEDLRVDGRMDTPLDGSEPPGQVHLKEIEVELTPGRDNDWVQAARPLTVRTIKAK